MSLAFKPHNVLVEKMTDPAAADLSTSTPTAGAPVQVWGQLVSRSSETIFRDYGLDLKNGFLFLMDLPDMVWFDVGYRVTRNGKIYAVRNQPRPFDAGDICDYACVVLEQLNLAN